MAGGALNTAKSAVSSWFSSFTSGAAKDGDLKPEAQGTDEVEEVMEVDEKIQEDDTNQPQT